METLCVFVRPDESEESCETDYFRSMFLTLRVLGFFLVPGWVLRAYE